MRAHSLRADLPAKAMLLNTKQFNGEFGCISCLEKGQYDNELFKKLNDLIWEFRTLYNGKAYRLYSFWDKSSGKETLVVATHGILKKTQKTPTKEIKKAEEIRKLYLEYKAKNK